MPRWLNLPNLLTLSRLVLVPFVVQAIAAGRHVLAFELFMIAAVTDALDGAVARRFHAITAVGAYFDPVADKCLLSGVFLAQALNHIVPWWLVALIFARDIYILAGACILLIFTSHRSFPPSVWGKLSTLVQVVTAVVWMARSAFGFLPLNTLSSAMLWPCAAITVWSGLDYTRRGVRLAKIRI